VKTLSEFLPICAKWTQNFSRVATIINNHGSGAFVLRVSLARDRDCFNFTAGIYGGRTFHLEMKDISSNPVTLIKVFPCSVLSEVVEAYTTFPIPLLATSPSPPPLPPRAYTPWIAFWKTKTGKPLRSVFTCYLPWIKEKNDLNFFFFNFVKPCVTVTVYQESVWALIKRQLRINKRFQLTTWKLLDVFFNWSGAEILHLQNILRAENPRKFRGGKWVSNTSSNTLRANCFQP